MAAHRGRPRTYRVGLAIGNAVKAAFWLLAIAAAALSAALLLAAGTVVVHAAVDVVRASWGLW